MTPWLLGVPLVVFAFTFAALVWIDHRERIRTFLDEVGEQVRETLESIGRLPFVILLALILLAPSPAQAGIRIDIHELVEALLIGTFQDVGGSPVAPGSRQESGLHPSFAPSETHPTPVAVEQEVAPSPPAPAMSNEAVIRNVFGPVHGAKAVAVARCESGLSTHPKGQTNWWGLFQMDKHARAVYGHGETAREQAVAAHGLFLTRGWAPWSCA